VKLAKLEKEQAKIQYDKKVAKSDGKVTPQERRKITRGTKQSKPQHLKG